MTMEVPSIAALMGRRKHEGLYDIRVGASSYAQIVSVFGSLAVPTVVVVFQDLTLLAPTKELTLALLIVGMLGSLGSGFALASIGAERDPTANLVPAVMFVAIPISVGLGSVFGAFGVMASSHLPEASVLFSLLLFCLGLFGVIFNGVAIADVMGMGPRKGHKDAVDAKWLEQQWIKNRAQGARNTLRVIITTALPVVAAFAIRVTSGWHFEPTHIVTLLTVIGLGALILFGILLATLRAIHKEVQVSLRRWEAYSANLTIALFFSFLLFVIP